METTLNKFILLQIQLLIIQKSKHFIYQIKEKNGNTHNINRPTLFQIDFKQLTKACLLKSLLFFFA